MKRLISLLILCFFSALVWAKADLKTEKDRISYALGSTLGNNMREEKIPFNPDVFMQGMQDALQGKPLQLNKEQIKLAMLKFQKQVTEKNMIDTKSLAEKNLKAGEAFLAENKLKEGVVTLQSGLQYKILKPGSGESPAKTDEVVVNYEGKFLDGTVFDSSFKRGQPATFPVNAVIPGWTEALQLMKPGAEWELYIPGNLAYGETGFPGHIEPNATLIFKVDLISVKKA